MRLFLIIISILFFIFYAYGQETIREDSLTIRVDTTSSVSGVDTVVYYTSTDSIVYDLNTKIMSLYSQGEIKHQNMELRADRIDINWNTATLSAFGFPDTSDTTVKKEFGTPVMKDRGEVYNGKELAYNFKTKRGRIIVVDTKLDEGFYHGDRLKKIGKDILFVADGRYTTCDKSDPHFYFYSPKMKVTLRDKVVAEPIYMYIADVPVFWFPVAVFPSQGGRRSGIIAPAIAEDAAHGRLLRHLGYYWAIDDYMDYSIKADLYTKGSWALSTNYQYNLRYYFSGGLSGEYRKMLEGEASDRERRKDISYNVHISHRQEINPTSRFDVNFTFASNNSYRNTINLNQALQQDIKSNATISKHWEGTPNSINLNISRRQNLISGNIHETLPSLSFNHSQSYPFRFGKGKNMDLANLAWYEMIGISYNSNFSNNRAKTKQNIAGVKATINERDTLITVEENRFDRNYRLSQGISMSIAPKLGHFTISPSMNYQDERSYSNNDIPAVADSTLITKKDQQWARRGSFSSGIGASTKLFGIVQPNALGVAALRHTITPNLSFGYQKQVIGKPLPPKQMTMSLNVGNNFEMKTIPKGDEEEGKKFQLLNLNGGISYNFSADSLNFSPINLNYRTSVGSFLDVGGGASFDLYKLEQIGPYNYNKVNKFLLIKEGRLARMTNFSINLSTTLSGEKKSGSKEETGSDTSQQGKQRVGYYALGEMEEEPDFSIPWQLSVSWDFFENKVPPGRSRSSSLRGNLDFNLTDNWKFTVNGGYDIANKEFVMPQINISRDLHCWIMNFTWVPVGAYRFYQFELRLKASQLQDIKVTKTGSASGIY